MSEGRDRLVASIAMLAKTLRHKIEPGPLMAQAAQAASQLPELAATSFASVLEQLTGEPGAASCLAYPGGKCRIRHRIVELMPPHRCYLEVFGGSAAVLLDKPRCEVEMYNDISPYMTGLMRVLKDQKKAAALMRRMAEELPQRHQLITRWLKHRQALLEGKRPAEDEASDVERALLLLVGLIYYSTVPDANAIEVDYTSVQRRQAQTSVFTNKILELPAIAARLSQVEVYRTDWRTFLQIADNTLGRKGYKPRETLLYLDPPYVSASISKNFNKAYAKAGEVFDDSEHEKIVHWALGCPAKVMISGKNHPTGPIAKLDRSAKYTRHEIKTRNRNGGELIECVWTNF